MRQNAQAQQRQQWIGWRKRCSSSLVLRLAHFTSSWRGVVKTMSRNLRAFLRAIRRHLVYIFLSPPCCWRRRREKKSMKSGSGFSVKNNGGYQPMKAVA